MDDLLIYSTDWQSHLEQLELTLRTIQENDISCSSKKTEIGFAEIEFLGYTLSADSVRISEKRIEAIGKITAPKNFKGLQRLLGMFNYWKKYIPSYSKHTFNMRKLLRKDVSFVWSPECEAELTILKQCLTTDPILKPIDPNRDLVLSLIHISEPTRPY